MNWTELQLLGPCTYRYFEFSLTMENLNKWSTNDDERPLRMLSRYYSARSYRLWPNIGFCLRGDLAVFTRSAITPPKVNRFGWNLEHSEYIVAGWPWHWQILGAIRAVATVWDAGEIFCQVNNSRFDRFPVGQISRSIDRRLGSRWKLSEHNFENRTVRGRFFKKRKTFSQNFNFLQLQAVITSQWLQIALNSLPNDPITGCLVSIFTVRINLKLFPWDVRCVQETY